jgi:hypothetical protein
MFCLALPSAAGIWLGLNDRVEEGKFSWLDGSPNDYTEWVAGQPTSTATKTANCVFKYYQNDKWYECSCERCTAPLVVLCQTETNATTILPF